MAYNSAQYPEKSFSLSGGKNGVLTGNDLDKYFIAGKQNSRADDKSPGFMHVKRSRFSNFDGIKVPYIAPVDNISI